MIDFITIIAFGFAVCILAFGLWFIYEMFGDNDDNHLAM